jgi:hypothetical protein
MEGGGAVMDFSTMPVIPAEAGISLFCNVAPEAREIPASAGMTELEVSHD